MCGWFCFWSWTHGLKLPCQFCLQSILMPGSNYFQTVLITAVVWICTIPDRFTCLNTWGVQKDGILFWEVCGTFRKWGLAGASGLLEMGPGPTSCPLCSAPSCTLSLFCSCQLPCFFLHGGLHPSLKLWVHMTPLSVASCQRVAHNNRKSSKITKSTFRISFSFLF